MSESDEKKFKKIKTKYDIDSSTNSASELSENDSGSSYVLLSSDELLSEESTNSIDEADYFMSSNSSTVEEESEVVWEDSDDNLELREELQHDAPWMDTKGLIKTIQKTAHKIVFKYSKKVFTARCKVKLFRCFPNIKVLVDSFNLIYMIKDFDSFKTYKIDLFKISDVCWFNNRILFSSNNSSYIKEVSVEGKVTDIKKGTGNIKKMVASTYLYILGDKLYALNQNLSILNEFSDTFIDVCINGDNVICLKENGDILGFDKDLNLRMKASFSFKFQFKGLYAANGKVFVSTDNGMVILNSDFMEIKTFSNLSSPITAFSSNQDFVIHASSYQNSFRILKSNDLSYFDKFPFSKIKISSIVAMDIDKDIVYFSDSRFISSLKLDYV